jgi:hypothetical protein
MADEVIDHLAAVLIVLLGDRQNARSKGWIAAAGAGVASVRQPNADCDESFHAIAITQRVPSRRVRLCRGFVPMGRRRR